MSESQWYRRSIIGVFVACSMIGVGQGIGLALLMTERAAQKQIEEHRVWSKAAVEEMIGLLREIHAKLH